ncbi:hypothetical protein DFS34DRAFT_589493 [Phlyctochytrium arcticum]|nr:hypothetical protein DFS34DRAFT_589493 [Phlyctochytrium arcticum]
MPGNYYTVEEPDSDDDNDSNNNSRMTVASTAVAPASPSPLPPARTPPRNAVANVFNGLRFLVGVASAASEFGFEAAKLGTRAGLGVARGVVDGIGDATGANSTLPGSTITSAVSHTLKFAEFCALAGIETGRLWTQFGLAVGNNSVSALNNVFGSTEVATAIKEFSNLIQRELSADGARPGGLSNLRGIGTVDTIRALMAWVALQSMTRKEWDRRVRAGGKRIVLEDTDGSRTEEPDELVNWVNLENGSERVGEGQAAVEGTIGTAPSAEAEQPSNTFSPPMTPPTHSHGTVPTSVLFAHLRRYIKFATGTYGRHYIGAFTSSIPSFGFRTDPDPRHVPASHSFYASHVDTPLESIFSTDTSPPVEIPIWDSNQQSDTYKPTLYVIADHARKEVIVAIRGTQSFHDVMVDLTCDYEDFDLKDQSTHQDNSGASASERSSSPKFSAPTNDGTPDTLPCHVHKGMLVAARAFGAPNHPSHIFEHVHTLLTAHPSYSLILTGHSLGSGLATCLTLLWTDIHTGTTSTTGGLPPGRPVHCYAFAAPCVVSPRIARATRQFITSIVVGDDLVCRLSLGSVRDLANLVAHFHSNPDARDDLVKRGLNPLSQADASIAARDRSLRKSMEQTCLINDKLFPAGRVLWITNVPSSNNGSDAVGQRPGRGIEVWDLTAAEAEGDGGEEEGLHPLAALVFGPAMAKDHLPHVYADLVAKI